MRSVSKIRIGIAAGLAIAFAGSAAAADKWYPYQVEFLEPAVQHGQPAGEARLRAVGEGVQAVGNLRVLPAHEGRLLARRRLWRRRRRPRTSASRCSWSRPAATPNLTSRSSQIEDCVAAGANAVVIGAISYDGLNNLVHEIRAKGIPVIDVINGMSSKELSAKSLVSFGEMGAKAGEYPGQDAPRRPGPGEGRLVPGTGRRRLGRGRQQGLPRCGEGQRHRGGRDEIRRHRQGSAVQARRGHARGPSGPRTTSSERQ